MTPTAAVAIAAEATVGTIVITTLITALIVLVR